jgi:hypothetical protein
MRGKSPPECRTPRIAPRNATLESARVRRHPRTTWERGRLARTQPYGGGFFGKPLRTISRFRHQGAQIPPSPLVGEGGGSQGWMFWLAPAYYLLFQASERPNSPFSPRRRRGQGGMGANAHGNAKNYASPRPSMIYGRTSTHNAGEPEEIVPIPVTSTSQRILHRASLPGGS